MTSACPESRATYLVAFFPALLMLAGPLVVAAERVCSTVAGNVCTLLVEQYSDCASDLIRAILTTPEQGATGGALSK